MKKGKTIKTADKAAPQARKSTGKGVVAVEKKVGVAKKASVEKKVTIDKKVAPVKEAKKADSSKDNAQVEQKTHKTVVSKPTKILNSITSTKKAIVKKKSVVAVGTPGTVTLKQVRSGAGRLPSQIATLKGLGLNKVNRISTLKDTPDVRGMIKAVAHLVAVIKN